MVEPHPVVSEVKIVGSEYWGYFFGKVITKQKNLVKCLDKLHKYAKSQEGGK